MYEKNEYQVAPESISSCGGKKVNHDPLFAPIGPCIYAIFMYGKCYITHMVYDESYTYLSKCTVGHPYLQPNTSIVILSPVG